MAEMNVEGRARWWLVGRQMDIIFGSSIAIKRNFGRGKNWRGPISFRSAAERESLGITRNQFQSLHFFNDYNYIGIYLKHLNQVESVPFVLGTSPSLPTTLVVAALIATANALNALSAL